MKAYFTRHNHGQSQGVYTNLTDLSDVRHIGSWYVVLQVGTWRLDLSGIVR